MFRESTVRLSSTYCISSRLFLRKLRVPRILYRTSKVTRAFSPRVNRFGQRFYRLSWGFGNENVHSTLVFGRYWYLVVNWNRTRDGHYWPPPAQIRTCGTIAYGSDHWILTSRVGLGSIGIHLKPKDPRSKSIPGTTPNLAARNVLTRLSGTVSSTRVRIRHQLS